jgi:hypothetical protein
MLCLVLTSCSGCVCCADPECAKTQDLAVVQVSNIFLDGRLADDIVVLNRNQIIEKCSGGTTLIGSEYNNAKFPVNIEVQLFLRGALIQSLEFEIPSNSILAFYNGAACDAIPDGATTYTHEGEFYRSVQQATDSGMFIDSSRSEIACWLIRQMEEDDSMRCTKYQDGGEPSRCRGYL